MPRRKVQLLIVAVVTTVFLVLFLRGVNFREVGAALSSARPAPIIAGVGLLWLSIWLRALRWRLLLLEIGTARLRDCYDATAIGFGSSVVLPLKAGEVIKPVLLGKWTGIPLAALLASVFVERVLDLVAIVGLGLLALVHGDGLTMAAARRETMSSAATVAIAALSVGVIILVLMAIYREAATSRLLALVRFLPDRFQLLISTLLEQTLLGLTSLRRPRIAALVAVQTLCLWLVVSLQVWASVQALDLELPFESTFLINAMGAFGLIFGTPGGVGSFHKTVEVGLGFYGITRDPAVAFAILHHFICFVPTLLIGVIALMMGSNRGGLSALKDITRGKESATITEDS